MSASPTGALQGLLKAVLGLGIVVVALLALLVAWWIALVLVGVWLLYAGVRRVLRGGRRQADARARTTIIDGEYRVEHELNARSSAEAHARITDSDDGRG